MSRTRRFLRGVKQEFNPREPFIRKVGNRNVNNLWTGRELGGKGKIAVGAAAVGYGAFGFSNARGELIKREANAMEPTPLPGTQGDMQDYTPHYQNAMGMEADGNLAFALHNLRHGG